ncbi:MAG: 50S ribosomal protein L6 [Alphaproteobacteria bacterium]|nr:50S ribosomal protein L6 [Alphaproteobacteria bacterium]MCB1550737.1 50S ribosomal protein L6 [Alphaproteobacteria bacterium]MCB9985646.1 50S ribosomal protein L6 [Micavibrio sp.]HRK98315.1 50S ribosomal protein L6 [Alphaproteobacteria bacterium]
MSRVGKNPVTVPSGVTIDLKDQDIKVKGPKGELTLAVHPKVSVKFENGAITVAPNAKDMESRALWATMQRRISNMVQGVTEGYTKDLEIEGVGYRCNLQGSELVLQLGFSHDIRYPIPQDITIVVEKQTQIKVSGIDKAKVGQIASEIRGYRPPEPYKGKGVRYAGEYILRKEGKKK